MRSTATVLLLGALLASCALDDDYYLESDAGSSGSGGAGKGGGGKAESPDGGGKAGPCAECTEECTRAEFGRKEYAFCVFDATYAQAEAHCGREGMMLAVVESAEEDAWILATMTGIYSGPQLRAFLGASDQAKKGEWAWANGEVFWRGGASKSGRYEHWADGEPATSSPMMPTEENCLTLTLADGTWSDTRCELPLPFVCESR